MTTSSTSCSTSQSARPRRSAGVVPTFWRSKWKSPSISTSATTTASIFLWTSIPAIRYGIGLSLGERRACLVASVRVASYRRVSSEPHDAQLFGQSRTLRTKQLLGLNGSTGWFDLAAPDATILAHADFHRVSGAEGPRQQLRKSSSAASQPRKLHRINGLLRPRVSHLISD